MSIVVDILVNTLLCCYVCDVDLEQKMFEDESHDNALAIL
jgi:hypothetical protein